MELTLALDILRNAAGDKQKETDVLNLAIRVLENTFEPEFTVLENLRADKEIAEARVVEVETQLTEALQVTTETVSEEATLTDTRV